MSRTMPLQAALSRSDSAFVREIRARIADGHPPRSQAEIIGEGLPIVVKVSWPEGEPYAALFLALDRRPEVIS